MNTIKFNSKSEEWGWMSNMAVSPLEYKGVAFMSVEAAFQAQKEIARAVEFCNISPQQARKLGRSVCLRKDWPEVKGYIMGHLLRIKFAAGSPLADKLLATGDSVLIEHAPWDKYWGDGGDGTGQNIMGRLLMKIRRELKEKR